MANYVGPAVEAFTAKHPTQVCLNDPCWCGTHQEKGAPRPDGETPWTQEGHDAFMKVMKHHGKPTAEYLRIGKGPQLKTSNSVVSIKGVIVGGLRKPKPTTTLKEDHAAAWARFIAGIKR
jgi:hypothetical protein